MIEYGASTDHERMVDVLLVGGPVDLPETVRSRRIVAATADEKIKVKHRSGYEHFVPSADSGGGETGPLVFRWVYSTKIAE
jgi:hypothetical protein